MNDVNPYEISMYAVIGFFGVVAAYVPWSRTYFKASRIGVIITGAIIYQMLLIKSVDWAYTHPFDSADGGPRAFATVIGWIPGLIGILLAFSFSMLLKKYVFRLQSKAKKAIEANDEQTGAVRR